MTDRHYVSESGEHVSIDDYKRWLEQGSEAFHALDANFENGNGAVHPDDRQNQLDDVLCHLRHFAQAQGFDFELAVERSGANFQAEKRKTVPRWARAIK